MVNRHGCALFLLVQCLLPSAKYLFSPSSSLYVSFGVGLKAFTLVNGLDGQAIAHTL